MEVKFCAYCGKPGLLSPCRECILAEVDRLDAEGIETLHYLWAEDELAIGKETGKGIRHATLGAKSLAH